MGKELVVADFTEAETEGEIKAAADEQSYIDVEIIEDEAPSADDLLDEADAAALEEGIASIFGSLRAEVEDAAPEDAEGPDMTFVLLDELNRLWVQAA